MIRYGSEIYFFHYVPPTERGSDVSKSRRPNPPFPGAELWQCSVYYYWWLFLRENVAYIETCERLGEGECAEVYRDFGDVRDEDFLGWWKVIGRELFCEPRTHSVQIESYFVRENFTAIKRYSGEPVHLIFDDGADLEKVLAEAENVIKAHYRGRSFHSRSGEKISRSLYPVFTKPVLQSLHQHYVALQLSKHPDGLKRHDIAQMSGAYATQGDQDAYWRKIAGSIGSREVNQAEMMVKYVGKGVFPVTTAEHEAEVEAFLARRAESSRDRREEVASGDFATPLGRMAQLLSGGADDTA